jgi:hypothetical protein
MRGLTGKTPIKFFLVPKKIFPQKMFFLKKHEGSKMELPEIAGMDIENTDRASTESKPGFSDLTS